MDAEENLWKIFKNINNWVQYAELKNTYLITFLTLELGLLNFRSDFKNNDSKATILFIGLSFLTSICSFFPKNMIVHWVYSLSHSSKKQDNNDNLLFYGHIAKYTPNQYLQRLQTDYKYEVRNSKYLSDLAAQIVINSGIADEKFSIFKLAFFFMFIAQLSICWNFLR